MVRVLHFQAKALVLGDSELALFSIPIFQTIYSITRSPTALIRALEPNEPAVHLGLTRFLLGDSKTVLPYVSVGLYASKRAEVAQSNVTKWYYTQKDQSTILLSGELGLHMVTENGWLLGAGYHSIRGPNLSLSKAF